MRTLEIGLVLPMGEVFVDGSTPRWADIRDLAIRAEEIGFDTVWVADELLWRPAEGPPQGCWECVAMTGAVAAATSRIKVGTWILSALHRNPGITAKAVETLDEISGGRFVFGLGAGTRGARRMPSACPRTTSSADSRRRSRSSCRSSAPAARTSRAPSMRPATWSSDPSARAPAGSRS